MKKTLAITLVGAMLLSVAGCSKSDSVAEDKVSFVLGLPGGDGVTPMRIVDNFIAENADKYVVEVDESSWGDFEQKVKLQMVAKNDVTTTFVTDSLSVPSFGAQGALEDLSARVDADVDESLYTTALRALTDEEGHLWGVPHSINPIAVAYNKDIFDAKGISYPTESWTFQDMLDMAKELTGDGIYGLHYGSNITQGWLPFFTAVDASPYKNGFRDANLDDPKVQEAYEKYQIAFNEGYCPMLAEIAAFGKAPNMFADGKIAMIIIQAGQTKSINNLNPDLNYDVQTMPLGWNGEKQAIYVPNGWVMYKGATDAQKDAAWEWMKYYLGEEAQMIVAEETPAGYPAMKTALEAVTSNGLKPEGKDAFYRDIDEYGMTILENPCSFQVEQIMQRLTNNVRDNVKPISELLQEAMTEMQEELDVYYENL